MGRKAKGTKARRQGSQQSDDDWKSEDEYKFDPTLFLNAQNAGAQHLGHQPSSTLKVALREIRGGRKKEHWIWYVLPTPPHMVGGKEVGGPLNRRFALRGTQGRDYLQHSQLRTNYLAAMRAVLEQLEAGNSLSNLFQDDAAKVVSSANLFHGVARNLGDIDVQNVCKLVLGRKDQNSCQKIAKVDPATAIAAIAPPTDETTALSQTEQPIDKTKEQRPLRIVGRNGKEAIKGMEGPDADAGVWELEEAESEEEKEEDAEEVSNTQKTARSKKKQRRRQKMQPVKTATVTEHNVSKECHQVAMAPNTIAKPNQSRGPEMYEFVTRATCRPILERGQIAKFVSAPDFGTSLCGSNSFKACGYDQVALLANCASRVKETALTRTTWSLSATKSWLHLHVNLCPRCDRPSFHCVPDIYKYSGTEIGTLLVDFANRHVGGGCFGGGFVQEEQMVMQSTDFAVLLCKHRETLTKFQAISYEGVHMDAWWPRAEAAKKEHLDLEAIQPCESNPFTILAVDAPVMRNRKTYTQDALEVLTRKILLIYATADKLQSPQIFSGLLGGGAFRNNRPLVLLLHLLLQPHSEDKPMFFHHPVFWCFGDCQNNETMEQRILELADMMLESLRERGVSTLGDALAEILRWHLPLNNNDGDLTTRQERTEQEH